MENVKYTFWKLFRVTVPRIIAFLLRWGKLIDILECLKNFYSLNLIFIMYFDYSNVMTEVGCSYFFYYLFVNGCQYSLKIFIVKTSNSFFQNDFEQEKNQLLLCLLIVIDYLEQIRIYYVFSHNYAKHIEICFEYNVPLSYSFNLQFFTKTFFNIW